MSQVLAANPQLTLLDQNKITKIKESQKRSNLLTIIQCLADRDYQARSLIFIYKRRSFYINIQKRVNYLVNDLSLNNELSAKAQLGLIYRSEEEITHLLAVVGAIEQVWQKIGHEELNLSYWYSPLWSEVIRIATAAYNFIKEQGMDTEYLAILEDTKEKREIAHQENVQEITKITLAFDPKITKITKIKHPSIRAGLIALVQSLADRHHQAKEWLSKTSFNFNEQLQEVNTYLNYDLELGNESKSKEQLDQGIIFRSEAEISAISAMMRAFDQVLNEIGIYESDDSYWDSALWQQLVDRAAFVYQLIKAQNQDTAYLEYIENVRAKVKDTAQLD